jgi:hypothetical protein
MTSRNTVVGGMVPQTGQEQVGARKDMDGASVLPLVKRPSYHARGRKNEAPEPATQVLASKGAKNGVACAKRNLQ